MARRDRLDLQRRRMLREGVNLVTGAALLAARPGASRAGVALPVLRFGQSAPLTGEAQDWGLEYQRGLRLAFDDANERGGVWGRRLELVTLDDQYEPALARANALELLGSDGVFALVGFVGAESSARAHALASVDGVPFVAPLTGDESLRRADARGVFNLHPADDTETLLIARALATIDFRRVAVLHQDDVDGAASVRSLARSLEMAGLAAPVALRGLSRNATARVDDAGRAFDAAARALVAARPDAVVLLSAYATTCAIVERLHALGYAGGRYATSLSGAATLGRRLGAVGAGLSLVQAVPSPFDVSRPEVAAYRRRLQSDAHVVPDHVSLEGWIAGRLCVEALARSGASPSRERFSAALESLTGHDLAGLTLRWDAQRRQFHLRTTLTVLDSEGRPRD